MKRQLFFALLVSAILAGCSDTNAPTTYNKPNYPKPDTTKTDTSTVPVPLPDNQIPKGQVDAPYLVFLMRSTLQYTSYLEKYRLDGTAKNMFLDEIYDPAAPWGFPDLSPKGDKMAFVHGDSIFMLEKATMTKTLVTATKKGLGLLTLSRDASKIVYSAIGDEWLDEYYVVDAVAGATPVKVKNMPAGDTYVASISPDGQKIAYDANGYVYVSDINGENRVRVSSPKGEMGDNYFPIFNKDGDKVIFISGFFTSPARLIAAPIKENGAAEAVVITDLTTAGLGFSTDFVLSGDGQHIYFVGYDNYTGSIYKIPTSGGAPFKLFSGVGDKTWGIAGMHFVEE
jgi:hypothetical protein